jgi:hypothetical protein
MPFGSELHSNCQFLISVVSRGVILKSLITPVTYFYSGFLIAPEMLNFKTSIHSELYQSEKMGIYSDPRHVIRLQTDGSGLIDENNALLMRSKLHGYS